MDVYSLVLQILSLCAIGIHGMPVSAAIFRNRILSSGTGKHVAITRSGRVHANADPNYENPDKDATRLLLQHLNQANRIRVTSVKYANTGRYLVVTPEGRIRAQVPVGANEVMEQILLPDGCYVFRFVNYHRIVNPPTEEEREGSGSTVLMPGSAEPEEICYLGFSTRTKRAECYSDINNPNVRLHVTDPEI